VAGGHVVSVGSFTKILSPGMRLGWIETAPVLAHRIAQHGVLVSGGGTAAFTSEIVAEALASGEQDVFLEHLRATYRESCSAMCDALEAAKCFRFHRPQGGYFVWVELPDGVTSDVLFSLAAARGVAFLPGSRCAVGGDGDAGDGGGGGDGRDRSGGGDATLSCDRHVRLCFAYEPAARLTKGVELLAEAVADARRGALP
jgi:DNA-binding transcriptional MocR family regulator